MMIVLEACVGMNDMVCVGCTEKGNQPKELASTDALASLGVYPKCKRTFDIHQVSIGYYLWVKKEVRSKLN